MNPLFPIMPYVLAACIFQNYITRNMKLMRGVMDMQRQCLGIKLDIKNSAENQVMENNVIYAGNVFKSKDLLQQEIEKPDPNYVYADDDGKLYFLHEVEYYFKGKLYSTLFWGEHGKDVSDKINAMAQACSIKQILVKEDLRDG